MAQAAARAQTQIAHGWIGSEIIQTRLGDFEFKGGFPTDEAARRLADVLVLNRAIEVYLAQMPAVSWFNVWRGISAAGSGTPNQFVIWESLMNAQTLLLTGNSETVYGLVSLDLRRDGPVVIETPPGMLGGINDMWQHSIMDVGPTGADKGNGGKFLLLPPDHRGATPNNYLSAKCTNYHMSMGVRGFLVNGKPDGAVALMKTTKIYPLAQSERPPATTFFNASGKELDTLFPDTATFFDDLAQLIEEEPSEVLLTHERFELAALGIEKGKPFTPDAARRNLLGEAARMGSALARRNSFASSDPARMVYQDRRWEWAFVGGSASWDSQGYINTDRRAAFAYAAIGMSPAMVERVVGQGSQYLWSTRDASGAHLDGAKSYQLHLPAKIPAKHFWSVVVYDAVSRSMLRNGQKYPSVSQYTGPIVNADGSVDIHFGPRAPLGKEKNWIKTLEDRGWFPLLRFYGPLEPFFDQSWKPGDITESR
jgi:hypothetical protein